MKKTIRGSSGLLAWLSDATNLLEKGTFFALLKKKIHTESPWIILAMRFLGYYIKSTTNKSKEKNEWDYIRLRSFCTAEETNQYNGNGNVIYRMKEHTC